MDWDVTEVSVTGDFALSVHFKDGVEGAVKFLPSFFRGVFSHLCDPVLFRQVRVVDGVLTQKSNRVESGFWLNTLYILCRGLSAYCGTKLISSATLWPALQRNMFKQP